MLNSKIGYVGAIYNTEFAGMPITGVTNSTFATLNVPAGTYIAILFARTDYNSDSRHLLAINWEVCGYANGAAHGLGSVGITIIALGAAGAITGGVLGESGHPSIKGWMGFLRAIRIK